MKNLVSIILVTVCFTANAQINTSNRTDYNEKTGSLRMTLDKNELISAQTLATNKTRLELPQETNLKISTQKTDNNGIIHYKYAQYHEGVRVEGGELLIHEKNGKAIGANGKILKGLTKEKRTVLSEEQALQKAISSFGAAHFVWNVPASNLPPQTNISRDLPEGELVWLPAEIWNLESSCMAYKFDIFSIEPLDRKWVYVNVETGDIVLEINQIKTHNCFAEAACNHTENNNITRASYAPNDEVFAQSNYVGEVLINTDFDTLRTQIGDTKIQVFNSDNQDDFPFNPFTSSDGTWSDPTAVDVHWGLESTYAYYQDEQQRNSYDDEGADIIAWAHFDSNFPNAFWAGSWMAFGDGNGNYSSLTSLDIIAHEFTHAVTQHSSKLIYYGESGALNESFSDIFGEIVEHYYHPEGSDWIVGADVVQISGKNGIRNLSNPKDPQMITQQPDTYKGEYWYEGNGDLAGVHTNSGVQNLWFHLLAHGGQGVNDNDFVYSVEGIGIEKAAQIAYETLTSYLTAGATYEDARIASIMAAELEFGESSVEAQRTAEAWCAVGVGNQCTSDISCAVRDSLILIEFYSEWNPNTPMDTWLGVGLNENRCVDSISLANTTGGSGQMGTSLTLLSELRYLNIASGAFSGYIPPEIGELSQLETLILNDNSLEGTLPPEIANLTNLKTLMCMSNNLSGPLPPEIGQLTNLVILYMDNNNFSGALPTEWGNLSNVQYFGLGGNALSGTIPSEWSGMSNLQSFSVVNNNLSGTIPEEFTNISPFQFIALADNQFEGPLPVFENSPFIVAMRIDGNRFDFDGLEEHLYLNSAFIYAPQAAINLQRNGNELSVYAGGNVADNTYEWYKDGNPFTVITGNNTLNVGTSGNYKCTVSNAVLTNSPYDAYNLVLESNELYIDPRPCALRDSLILVEFYYATGESDSLQWNFTQPMSTWNGVYTNTEGCVRYLALDDKGLSGTLPESLYNLSELERLFLYRNPGLNGNTIPPTIGNLTKLEMYSISSCGFTDTIPDELGQLTDLWHLSIGNNDFSGIFPTTLLQLAELEYLQISQNNFTGFLPEGLGNLTKLEYLGLHGNEFEGAVSEALAGIDSLSELEIYNNNFTSPLPVFPNDMALLNIRENGFNFDDVMKNIHLLDNDFIYEDQNKLPISSNGNALYVDAGGNLADNTYIWYEQGNGTPIDTIVGNNEYTPAVAGAYYCEVANALLTNNILKDQNLILTSETYSIEGQTSEPVYPGDMDNNGVVNNYDILYWGMSNGYTGYARPDASTTWTPQPASNWLASVKSVNAKHQDADGNGVINEADIEVIMMNYDSTHTNTTLSENNNSPDNLKAEIVSKVRQGNLTVLTVNISLENDAMIPISTHGIAFDLNYESEVPVEGIMSVDLNFGNSWLAGDNVDGLKTVTHIDNDSHTLSFGITRDDRQNMIGVGQIGTAAIIICENIIGGDAASSRIVVENGSSMSANQIITPLTGSTHDFIDPPLTNVCIDNDDHSLLVLPFDESPNGLSDEIPTQANLTYDTGLTGEAAYIFGYGNGLTFNASDNFNATEGTLETWVRPDWNGNDGQSHTILQAGLWGGMLVQKDGGNYLRVILNRWAYGGQPEVSLSYRISDWEAGAWQHIACTWGNGQVTLYVNGNPVESKSYSYLPQVNITEFNIGKDYWNGHNWDGLIDELRISNRVRTPQEITDAILTCSPAYNLPTDACADNDNHTLLVLPFDDSPVGLESEIPIYTDLATYNTGINGQAANISDEDSGLTFSTNNNLNTAEGTLEVWLKPLWNGNDGQSHTILQAGTWGGILMEKDGGNYLKIILNRWRGADEVSLGHHVADWQAGEWQHVAYTWGNGQAQMYINGIPVASKTYGNLPELNVSEFNIGKDHFGGDTWDGLMDELKISDIARSPQEIADAVANCSSEMRFAQQLEIVACNYPDPFTEYTTIEFELLEDNLTTIQIFDMKGSPIATMLNEHKTKGKHQTTFDAGNLPAGMYYYSIRSGAYSGNKSMMIIK